jgi:hypothetical protein
MFKKIKSAGYNYTQISEIIATVALIFLPITLIM